MTNQEIDELVVPAETGADGAMAEGIARKLAVDLRAVRPVAPAWVRAVWLVALTVGISAAIAAGSGLAGVERLGMGQVAVIFSVLALATALAAAACVAEMTPGARRVVGTRWVFGGSVAAMAGVFALLFQDYGMDRFVPQGLRCFRVGLLVAAATAPAIWAVLRRGFAVHATAAGLAAGTLAGLAGVAMLELHCPNFHTWHVVVWHTAVVVACGGIGWGVGTRALRGRAFGGN